MARHGITAKLTINGKYLGVKDITLDMSGNEVEISSRGQNYKRYLRGQKNFSIETSIEMGTDVASEVRGAYNSGDEVAVTLTDASTSFGAGDTIVTAQMIVLNCTPSFPTDGEATYDVKLGLSALSNTNPTIM